MIYKNDDNNKDIKRLIKEISVKEDISISKICEKLNILPQSYQNIFKKKNISLNDISNILDCMDYDLELDFKKRENK